jgi:hypothetical protein
MVLSEEKGDGMKEKNAIKIERSHRNDSGTTCYTSEENKKKRIV